MQSPASFFHEFLEVAEAELVVLGQGKLVGCPIAPKIDDIALKEEWQVIFHKPSHDVLRPGCELQEFHLFWNLTKLRSIVDMRLDKGFDLFMFGASRTLRWFLKLLYNTKQILARPLLIAGC